MMDDGSSAPMGATASVVTAFSSEGAEASAALPVEESTCSAPPNPSPAPGEANGAPAADAVPVVDDEHPELETQSEACARVLLGISALQVWLLDTHASEAHLCAAAACFWLPPAADCRRHFGLGRRRARA